MSWCCVIVNFRSQCHDLMENVILATFSMRLTRKYHVVLILQDALIGAIFGPVDVFKQRSEFRIM